MPTLPEILDELERLSNPAKVAYKRQKFGIIAHNSLGIYHADLKQITKRVGRNDDLALALFDTGIYEARLLCAGMFKPASITPELMEEWVATFENWEICDTFCMGFFAKSKHAIPKALEWAGRSPEFEKRAGFAIMAAYGFADKKAGNEVFEQFLPLIEREARDERLYVKKAVNWALRNIGKRNIHLHAQAIDVAHRILKIDNKSAQWIAVDALKQLQKPGANILDYPRTIYRPK